ncbi:MFS transporter small subunit [Fulvimarina sp. 2208YS6-2-32]
MAEPSATSTGQLVAAWAFVGIPLAWGIVMTVKNASALFY